MVKKTKIITTVENLSKAFVGESMARNKYTFYAKAAQKEGFEMIANIFLQTAEQEREHASWLYKLLNQLKEKYKINVDIPIDADVHIALGSTVDNLESSIEGETYEYTKMYPEFASVADKEGLHDIAKRLRAIAIAEKHHEERYSKLLKELNGKTLYKKNKVVTWVCLKCGYMHKGRKPQRECPSCGHSSAYFEKQNENY